VRIRPIVSQAIQNIRAAVPSYLQRAANYKSCNQRQQSLAFHAVVLSILRIEGERIDQCHCGESQIIV
jgi:hypothetical protein